MTNIEFPDRLLRGLTDLWYFNLGFRCAPPQALRCRPLRGLGGGPYEPAITSGLLSFVRCADCSNYFLVKAANDSMLVKSEDFRFTRRQRRLRLRLNEEDLRHIVLVEHQNPQQLQMIAPALADRL